MTPRAGHDVAVVGGGAAGLSAAVTLARSLRSVVVIDGGEPRNAPAAGVHNLLGREGTPPDELLAAGRREAAAYGVDLLADRAVSVGRTDTGFALTLAGGDRVTARRLVLATGLVDVLPDVPGLAGLWGRRVLHCPYCHGFEVRGQRVAVLSTGPMTAHQALLFGQLSEHVSVLLHDGPDLDEDAWEQLAALDIEVVDGRVERLALVHGPDEEHVGVTFEDGREVLVDAVAVAPTFSARADLWEQLGGTLTEHPMGTRIAADPLGRTALPGVWAAGNVTDLGAMVGVASGAGVMAGASVNADLVAEDAAAAVRGRRPRSGQ